MQKIILIAVSFCASASFAQTPFDSFDTTMKSVPLFKSDKPQLYKIDVLDKTSKIKYLVLDVDNRILAYYDQKDSLLIATALKPNEVKFLSVDPLSKKYPELTPYQFASNTPIQAIDLDGLEAYAVFNKSTGQLALVPDISQTQPKLSYKFVNAFDYSKLTTEDKTKYNYGILVQNVFTGGHYDANQKAIVKSDPSRPKELPIATGEYNILENKGNTNPAHNSFFVLDPADSKPYNKVDDRPGQINSDGEKRSGYNLHPGQVSWGCVTVCSQDPNLTPDQRSQEWSIINQAINNTKTEVVPDNRGMQKYNPFSTQIKFGTLKVIETAPVATPTPVKPHN
jgi:hypothetical protein